MKILHYKDIITRAVNNPDDAQLDALAHQLKDCAEAREMLRNKGYGTDWIDFCSTIKLIPSNFSA